MSAHPAHHTAAHGTGHSTPSHCRNCEAPLPSGAHYCPQCGQDTAPHPPTLAEFTHEFFDHYIALEGSIWRTLWLLMRKPGELTREYLAGRKRRYVLPLRLYLSLALLAVLALSMTSSVNLSNPNVNVVAGADGAQAVARPSDQSPSSPPSEVAQQAQQAVSKAFGEAKAQQALELELSQAPVCRLLPSVCKRLRHKWVDQGEAAIAQELYAIPGKMLKLANYGMLLMMPVYAALLALAYRKRRMTFGEHMVFSLHAHSLAALLLLVSALPWPLEWVLLLLPIHTTLAMHRVYGGRWPITIARAIGLSAVYSVLLIWMVAALVLVAAVY